MFQTVKILVVVKRTFWLERYIHFPFQNEFISILFETDVYLRNIIDPDKWNKLESLHKLLIKTNILQDNCYDLTLFNSGLHFLKSLIKTAFSPV